MCNSHIESLLDLIRTFDADPERHLNLPIRNANARFPLSNEEMLLSEITRFYKLIESPYFQTEPESEKYSTREGVRKSDRGKQRQRQRQI